jgi:1,4-alpha-glucan branching enzyme
VPRGFLCLVLHWHLPFVRHPEQERFLEEDWLFEAITETYLPLLRVFERLEQERVGFRLTISVSPSLAEMLRDELLQGRYLQHLERMSALAERELGRTRDDPALNGLAEMYLERFRRCRREFEVGYERNLLRGLAHFQEAGLVELITSGATHSFLPLFETVPEAVKAQIAIGASAHLRNFGVPPRGFWLPECGYYPGVEEFCRLENLSYFFLETHGVLYADQRPRYGVYAPIYCPNLVAAFGRDPESARAVWSAQDGYPGDPVYREFYRDIGFDLPLEQLEPFLPAGEVRVNTGIKYHAITGNGEQKRLYNPKAALAKAEEHAEHFLGARMGQVERLAERMDLPPLIVAPFDAELFGHWWFEGPEWIESVIRRLSRSRQELTMVTPGEYLERYPDQQVAQPCFSSWGNKGYAEVWLEGSNDWIYRHLHGQSRRMVELARRFPNEKGMRRRALNQALREMLLAQASDWAFMMKTGTTVPYAVRRTREHLANFDRIYDLLMSGGMDQEWLTGLESRDNIFAQIDYRGYGR